MKEKVKTYADRIRAMTDKELALFLFPLGSCPVMSNGLSFVESGTCAGNCRKCWLEWLKQEDKNE